MSEHLPNINEAFEMPQGGYGRIWESMYRGSMVGSGLAVFALMPYVIANMRPHPEHGALVELNPQLLAFIFGADEQTVRDGIAKLCEDDPRSRTPGEEGKRLVKLGPFLYRVVNGAAYIAIRKAEANRQKNREAVARHRQNRKSSQPITGEATAVKAMAAGDEETADVLAAERKVSAAPPSMRKSKPIGPPPSGHERLRSDLSDSPGLGPAPVRRNRTLAEHQAARTAAASPSRLNAQTDVPNSPPTLPASPGVTARSPSKSQSQTEISPRPQSALVALKPSRPPSPPNQPAVSLMPQGAGAVVPTPRTANPGGRAAADNLPSGVRPAGQVAATVLASLKTQTRRPPAPLPVNPAQIDQAPRTEAGVVANTGASNPFSGWQERTVVTNPTPRPARSSTPPPPPEEEPPLE